jgi:hypothetical protein
MDDWRFLTDGGELIAYLPATGLSVNFTRSSNGWFRFIDPSSKEQKICWSGGSCDPQNFPDCALSAVSSLEIGSGDVIAAGLSFGTWSFEENDQLLAAVNSSSPVNKVTLTRTGFVFMGNHRVTLVENQDVRFCSKQEGERALEEAMTASVKACNAQVPKSNQTFDSPDFGVARATARLPCDAPMRKSQYSAQHFRQQAQPSALRSAFIGSDCGLCTCACARVWRGTLARAGGRERSDCANGFFT